MINLTLAAIAGWLAWTTYILFQTTYLVSYGLRHYQALTPEDRNQQAISELSPITNFAQRFIGVRWKRWTNQIAAVALTVAAAVATEHIAIILAALAYTLANTFWYERVRYPVYVWAVRLRQTVLERALTDVGDMLFAIAVEHDRLQGQGGGPDDLAKLSARASNCIATGLRIKAELNLIAKKIGTTH